MMIDPEMIGASVEGLDFPASKDEVVRLAEARGAPHQVLEHLRSAEGDRFDDLQQLQQAVRRIEIVEAQVGSRR
jgi:hypothetical protein